MDIQIFLKKKLEEAKRALITRKAYFTVNSTDLVDEFMDLNIDQSEEIWPLLLRLFDEIQPKHYIGPDFVFRWDSDILDGTATLNFILRGEYFYYISLKKTTEIT